MLTLGSELLAAQSSQYRKPLIEILTMDDSQSLPFDGQELRSETDDEFSQFSLVHSSNRLLVTYIKQSTGPDFHIEYGYTDVDRMYWTWVEYDVPSASAAYDIALTEMPSEEIGLVYHYNNGAGNSIFAQKVIPLTGGTATHEGTIATITATTVSYVTGPALITLANATYLMVYASYDSGHSHLYKRTSSDFETWASASELSIAGLDDTKRKANPSLLQITTGQIWLWFDYLESIGPNGEELTNVYYSTSDDNGATWSTAVKFTNFTDYSAIGNHPVSAQHVADNLYVLFNKQQSSVHMDSDTDGWEHGCDVSQLHFDTVNRKLYVVASNGFVYRQFYAIYQIDVDTWAIDKHWDSSSSPAIPSGLGDDILYKQQWRGESYYVLVGDQNHNAIALLNADTDDVKTYYFQNVADHGWTQNVTWDGGGTLYKAWLDSTNNKLWLLFVNASFYTRTIIVGWIDITATDTPYTLNVVVNETNPSGFTQPVAVTLTGNEGWFEVNQSAGLIIVCGGSITSGYTGGLRVYDINTGGLWRNYIHDSSEDETSLFPLYGLRRGLYMNNKIYGDFTYSAAYGETDKRGLCIVDLTYEGNAAISYNRPTWSADDEYYLRDMVKTDDDRLVIAMQNLHVGGVAVFDGYYWTLYDNDTVQGFTPSGEETFNTVAYDPLSNLIFGGVGDNYLDAWTGLVMFSEEGYLKQAQYYTGEYGGSTWTWTNEGTLVQGYADYDATLQVDPVDSGIYAFWTKDLDDELSINWDKEIGVDLSSQLVKDSVITYKQTIDGTPKELRFTVANGHLFDPYNASSLWKIQLEKGRTVKLRIGETVDGTDYWQDQGKFVVTETRMSGYDKEQYPTMEVVAQDRSVYWEQHNMTASGYYSTDPVNIISDLLQDHAQIASGDIDLPAFDGSSTLYHQWVDTSLKDAVDQVARRFGYFVYWTVENKVSARKISDSNSVNIIYADNTKLISFTPDDSYSDFTNQIIVKGEERDFIEVLYPEERVADFNASHRWNTGTKEYRIYYSEDMSRKAANPRLIVQDSVTSLAFDLAGKCSEDLSDNSHSDPDPALWDKYCTLEVSSPDLTMALIVALGATTASLFIPDGVMMFETFRVGSAITGFCLMACLTILAATGNFQYEIWANPIGQVRRSVQSDPNSTDANDFEMQARTGMLITKTFDDALCYSSPDCEAVAAFEMMLVKCQRKRFTAKKVVDLRLEAGDTIQCPHPWSGETLTLFITDVTRSYKPTKDTGEYFDDIEGWVI